MKDLDFDELDRAVNSLLTGNDHPVEGDAPATQSATLTTVSTSDVPVTTPVPLPPADRPAVTATPLAARRSTGRFMDVVHPSMDMRSQVPQRPVSRVGVHITPSGTPLVGQPTIAPAAPTPAVNAEPDAQAASTDWPDPIDFNSPAVSDVTPDAAPASDALSISEIDDNEDDSINQIADDINKTLNEEVSAQPPLESPFLADTKVEKRPLGAFSGGMPTPIAIDPLADTPASDDLVPDEIVPDMPVSIDAMLSMEPPVESSIGVMGSHEEKPPMHDATPLPAELQQDVLMIEADTDTSSTPAEPVVETPPPVIARPAPMPVAAPTQAAANVPVVESGSIAPQYSEKPSTGDQPASAIYDTEAYRRPLNHPAKKKSGWIYVLWIFLLLVAGAGAGAAVYFFVLPKL